MKLIIGLGNTGSSYAQTRHNAGHLLIEQIAAHHKISFSDKKDLKAHVGNWTLGQTEVRLATLKSFMNTSGGPVARLVKYYEIHPERDLLVIVDDIALPLGRLKLRPQGSDGGHNGLKSIDAAFGNGGRYARLRIGVGAPAEQSSAPLEDYVLMPFSEEEKRDLGGVLGRGVEACEAWLTQPIEAAMNVVNPFQD